MFLFKSINTNILMENVPKHISFWFYITYDKFENFRHITIMFLTD